MLGHGENEAVFVSALLMLNTTGCWTILIIKILETEKKISHHKSMLKYAQRPSLKGKDFVILHHWG